jgi:hypothetical protein
MKPRDSVALGHLIHNDRSTPMHAAGLPVDGYRFILVNPPAVRCSEIAPSRPPSEVLFDELLRLRFPG